MNTRRHFTVIYQGLAHLYPVENLLFTVELHTNTFHFVLGGRTFTRIPNPSPLFLTLFCWGRQWHGA